ncbi:SDR family oxidoreductase [Algiphilus sp.]|uniref:SDR family oxidoreductase n=1 Tax=Algiphilus sp. TaxID=1872431 RepID=UPI0025BDB8F2|nr:SDR family oxidoreductase [Algiphilus sp.]MCI5061933.1 SDR family oxidoreductase [Algiphilus sp.]MCI5102897.1 SDR family oxidoreductase [Algiphilus sp.]MCR9091758.1 SDR family oxidoreductase [Pseudomonadota bacterium]
MLTKLPNPYNVLIVGANRGIGLGMVRHFCADMRVGQIFAACREPSTATELHALAEHDCRLRAMRMDVEDDQTVADATAEILRFGGVLHAVIVTAGVLHDDGMRPERRLADIDVAAAERSFRVNALGPLLVLKHVEPLLRQSGGPAYFASISARVGSIGDNRIGGWYSYRAAKAAQNQFVHTASIELARRHSELTCVTLHPGTVDTALSEPFQGRVKPEKLFSVERASRQLLTVLDGLGAKDSGGFFAWDGQPIPW